MNRRLVIAVIAEHHRFEAVVRALGGIFNRSTGVARIGQFIVLQRILCREDIMGRIFDDLIVPDVNAVEGTLIRETELRLRKG